MQQVQVDNECPRISGIECEFGNLRSERPVAGLLKLNLPSLPIKAQYIDVRGLGLAYRSSRRAGQLLPIVSQQD
jgi:hypothetical protein